MKLTKYKVHTESIFDIRYLAEMCAYRPAHLSILSATHLNIELNEWVRLEPERWKKQMHLLKVADINYAARVVRVTMGLFEKFQDKFMCDKPDVNDMPTFIDAKLKPYFNKIYRKQKNSDETQAIELADICREAHVISDAEKCAAIVHQLREYSINEHIEL